MDIGYLSEPDKDYCRLLDAQKTLPDLRKFVRSYKLIAADALKIVDSMTGSGFRDWRAGLKLERRGKFAGEAWAVKYGAVLMPAIIVQVGLLASDYNVPFGLAYIRMRDAGRLTEAGGVAMLT